MRAMLIFLLITVSCTVSGIQSAHASTGKLIIEQENTPLTREERIIKNIVDRNKGIDLTVHEKTYIYNDPQSIADREFADDVKKLDKSKERYNGR